MTNGRCRRGVNLGVSYIQVHRWIDEQGLELRLEVKAVLRGCGTVASGLYLRGWRFGVGDTLAGKGVIDVGNIFSFCYVKIIHTEEEGVET